MVFRFLILFLLVNSVLPAQSIEEVPAPHEVDFYAYTQNPDHRAVLSGKILNLPPAINRDSLFHYSAVTLLREDQREEVAAIAEDGTFSVMLPDGYPLQEVWFWLGEHFYGTFIIKDGVNVTMDYAALAATENNEWEHPGVTFSGPDSGLATYRSHQVAVHLRDTLDYMTTMNDRDLSAERKHAIMEGIYRDLQKRDDKLLAGASAEVAAILKRKRKTEYLGYLNVVYWGNDYPENLREVYREHRPLTVSNRTRDFYAYHTAQINGIGTRKAREMSEIKPTPSDLAIAGAEHFIKKVGEYYDQTRADLLKLYLSAKDPIVNTRIMELLLPTMADSWAKDKLQVRYKAEERAINKLRESLDRRVDIIAAKELGKAYGSLPFGADLYVVGDDVSGEELLDKLRGAFSGKALYLDFWATWCAPCLGEMPHSTKLHSEAKGLPLEFIYLCTDSGGSEEKWRNIIASHQVGGTHIYVPTKAHSELMKLFNGRGFPTYVLLQADGTSKLDIARPSGLDREKLEALLR